MNLIYCLNVFASVSILKIYVICCIHHFERIGRQVDELVVMAH